MSQAPTEQQQWLANYHKEDATDRLRYQQEFSVSGFKTLILINGGAVIGLLTYAGNASDKVAAGNFQFAFGGYILGLVMAVLAYLPAYFGQAVIMQYSAAAAFSALGLQETDEELQDRRIRWSNLWIGSAIALCVLSLLAFLAGSVAAMRGLT